jgi:endoglucanase
MHVSFESDSLLSGITINLPGMKQFLAIILFISVSTVCAIAGRPVDTHGQLRVEVTHIVDRNGQKAALKGISLGWHNWWSQFYNPSAIEYLSRNWHISVIRAAMGIEAEDGYLENPEEAEKLVTTVIDAAIANGIYVIIDWHAHDMYTEKAEAFFTRMAERYAGIPNILYEIYNEPTCKSWNLLKAYSVRIIESIRRYDDKNLIIVGTPGWSRDVDIVADDPIDGYDNIMYALHFYAASHKAELREKVEYALNKDLPIFVSECSPSEETGDGELDKKEFSLWARFLKQHGISFVLWGLYDKGESSAMLKYETDPNGNWSASQLTEMGYYSRRLMGGGPGATEIIFSIIGVSFLIILVFPLIRKILAK